MSCDCCRRIRILRWSNQHCFHVIYITLNQGGIDVELESVPSGDSLSVRQRVVWLLCYCTFGCKYIVEGDLQVIISRVSGSITVRYGNMTGRETERQETGRDLQRSEGVCGTTLVYSAHNNIVGFRQAWFNCTTGVSSHKTTQKTQTSSTRHEQDILEKRLTE